MVEVKTERNLKRDQLTRLIQEAKGNVSYQDNLELENQRTQRFSEKQ